MIKTTRIKYSQAPRVVVDDLTVQCDGVTQTFKLRKAVPEWAPYCVLYNGQVYTNTSYHKWFELTEDRATIKTSFPVAPKQGINKSLILVVGVAGSEDLVANWDDMINKPEFSKVAFSGDYEDILNTPERLPNPYPITVDGIQYDGSEAIEINTSTTGSTAVWGHINGNLAGQKDLSDKLTAIEKSVTDSESTSSEKIDRVSSDNAKAIETLKNELQAEIDALKTQAATIPVITVTNIDPGEGATLKTNHFIGVYQ